MRKEIVFSLEELRQVCLTCPHCNTEVVLDLAGHAPPGPGSSTRRMAFAPAQCPACKVPYDSASEALEALHQAFTALSKLDGFVTFRAPGEKEEG